MDRKRICIIYTGGTIGMVAKDNGYAPEKGILAEVLADMSELSSEALPEWELIEFDPLLDSSNVTYEEWNKIARTIEANYDSFDGFVVLHGTDTMAFTASAVSFMIDGLAKPVVFTGSQIPLCEVRSDGRDNLITSLIIAADGIVKETSLYFGHELLRGNRAIKLSSDRMIAFSSPNYPVLANAGVEIEYNSAALLPPSGDSFKVNYIEKCAIAVIKLIPGMSFDMYESIVSGRLDALVLETFGTGNIPSADATLPPLIKRAIDNGTTVVVLTQCPEGSVRLGTYETSSSLAAAGVVSGCDMTTEAAVAKLSTLISLGFSGTEMKKMMETNLRGEFTE